MSSTAVSLRPRLERLVERVRLPDRAREAVEQEAVVALGVDALEQHLADHLVGHEGPLGDDPLDLAPEVGVLLALGAHHVAGGDVGQAEVGRQVLGLRALAGPRRADEDEVQLAHEARKPIGPHGPVI
jgi:hypothetical protein